jgi:hypothetical protein
MNRITVGIELLNFLVSNASDKVKCWYCPIEW